MSDKKGIIADKLANALADTYTLMLKTQNYHWNVTGYRFRPLHSMFEDQYKDLFEAADLLAERIRALGFFVPASYTAFSDLTHITSETDTPNANTMIENLVKDHRQTSKTFYEVIELSKDTGDEVSTDIAIERLRQHEKTIWMLESMLEEDIA